jgi:type IV secretion system protein VirB11
MAIRRHRLVECRWTCAGARGIGAPPPASCRPPDRADRWLCGGGGGAADLDPAGGVDGKTTDSGALLAQVPQGERIVLVEDAPEIRLSQPNALGLVAVKGAGRGAGEGG